MLLTLLFFYSVAAHACTVDSFGYWIVKNGETTDMVAQCLLVSDEYIGNLNKDKGMVVGSIRPNQKWKVPHESACSSASWRTETLTVSGTASCVAFLEMSPATTFVTSAERTSANSEASAGANSRTAGEKSTATNVAAPSVSTHFSGDSSVLSGTQGQSTSLKNTVASTDVKVVSSPKQTSVNSVTATGTDAVPNPGTTVSTSSAPKSSVAGSVNSDRRCYDQIKDAEFFNQGEKYKTDEHTQNIFVNEFCKGVDKLELRDNEPFFLTRIYAGGNENGYSFSLIYQNPKDVCKNHQPITMVMAWCQSLLRGNYLECQGQNDGLGGVIKQGCLELRYMPVNLLGATTAVVPSGMPADTATASSNSPTSIATDTIWPTTTTNNAKPPPSTATTTKT